MEAGLIQTLLTQAGGLIGILLLMNYRIGRLEKDLERRFDTQQKMIEKQIDKNENFIKKDEFREWVSDVKERLGQIDGRARKAHKRLTKHFGDDYEAEEETT